MKFTKEEKKAFVKRYQDGETVISICSENQIPRSPYRVGITACLTA